MLQKSCPVFPYEMSDTEKYFARLPNGDRKQVVKKYDSTGAGVIEREVNPGPQDPQTPMILDVFEKTRVHIDNMHEELRIADFAGTWLDKTRRRDEFLALMM